LGPIYGQYASDVVLAHGRQSAEANLWKALTVSAADNASAKAAVEKAGGTYVDRFASICRDAKCQAFVGDNLLILDSVHMSLPGATWVAGQLGSSQLLP
jgi:hypothetical protein